MVKKRYLLFALTLPLFFLYFNRNLEDHFDLLPTEYTYSDHALKEYRSIYLITLNRIDKWENPLQTYFQKHQISYLKELRFYTYLYLAQKEATFLSYNVHHSFIGSLDPLTYQVVTTFFPEFKDFPELVTDPFSEELAKHVWPCFKARIEEENRSIQLYAGQEKFQAVTKWIPWVLPLPQPPPPCMDLKAQVEQIKQLRSHLSENERILAKEWAGQRHLWELAKNFMEEERIPLGKTLYVRAILMKALYDAEIAAFDAKYTYCIPRPIEIDPTLQPLIKTPNSPSYPSGHAVQGGSAEVVMSFFFPKHACTWKQIAEECAWSRIWGGVHTLQDIEVGLKLGQAVGERVLERR